MKKIIHPIEDTPLCACGCGEKVKWNRNSRGWNKYIHCHFSRGIIYFETQRLLKEEGPPPLCACGCGKFVTMGKGKWNVFVCGHSTPTLRRNIKIQQELLKEVPLCACGCGERVGWSKRGGHWNLYIFGHHAKGNTIWKGRKHTEETKLKMSLASTGIVMSEESKLKNSEAHIGKICTEETKLKMAMSKTGKKHSDERIKNMKKAAQANREKTRSRSIELWKDPTYRHSVCIALPRGENHHNWKGGITAEPYCINWNLPEFKDIIKERDNYQCQNPDCWKTSNRIVVHHIDYVKKNCDPDNLITLCNSCNLRANFNREQWQEFYTTIVKRLC